MDYQETSLDEFESFDGNKFPVHIWEPESPNIVLIGIHGGLAHGGDFVTIGTHFMNKGVVSISYTLRGHLQKKTHIKKFDDFVDDALSFVNWVKEKYPDLPIVIFGHSVGTLILNKLVIEKIQTDDRIKGYIFSSPYFENALKAPKIALMLAPVLAALLPKLKAPAEYMTDYTTRDQDIVKRHKEDETKNIRGTEASMRFANELLKMFKWIEKNISRFPSPCLYLISGDDKIADSKITVERIKLINEDLVESHVFTDSYHEGYNDLDRETFFKHMEQWMRKTLDLDFKEAPSTA
ncbi:MAG: alpha/beta fold hydrolase [Candidatus Heimdallarchaeota archaeon]|nr:alpha/beta fold hydrolase [Candidatus Heimdallarchaeota archaeon]